MSLQEWLPFFPREDLSGSASVPQLELAARSQRDCPYDQPYIILYHPVGDDCTLL